MDDLFILLQKIRKKPTIYLGKPSLELLYALIIGYVLCIHDKEGYYLEVFPGFLSFVEDTFRVPHGEHGWADIILMHSKDDCEAFYKFYELLEEFQKTGDEHKGEVPCPPKT